MILVLPGKGSHQMQLLYFVTVIRRQIASLELIDIMNNGIHSQVYYPL